MAFNSLRAKIKQAGNLFVRLAFSNQLQHFFFPFCEQVLRVLDMLMLFGEFNSLMDVCRLSDHLCLIDQSEQEPQAFLHHVVIVCENDSPLTQLAVTAGKGNFHMQERSAVGRCAHGQGSTKLVYARLNSFKAKTHPHPSGIESDTIIAYELNRCTGSGRLWRQSRVADV